MYFDPRLIFALAVLAALFGGLLAYVLVRKRKCNADATVQVTKGTASDSRTHGDVAITGAAITAEPLAPQARPRPGLSHGLTKTTVYLQSALDRLFANSQGDAFYQDLEDVLLSADVGITITDELISKLRKNWGVRIPERRALVSEMRSLLEHSMPELPSPAAAQGRAHKKPHVVMIVGINGVGKTTTVGKLCQQLMTQGNKVLVGAADTFRAAATEQLRQWVERTGAQGVFQKEGSDPSAVAFDTVQSAVAKQFDYCLVDTAGRLHTKHNLMDELQKMKRVMGKALDGAPHDVWLVVDGATGQNALNQAREFHRALGLTGIIVTKLDGSAKGGVLLSIVSELKVPVILVGVGEGAEDLISFNRKEYLSTLLDGLA